MKRLSSYIGLLLLSGIILFISACGTSEQSSDYNLTETGALAFSLVWEDPSSSDIPNFGKAALSDNCGDVETVRVAIYDGNTELRSADFLCSDGHGTIDNITPGSRKVVIHGLNSNKKIRYWAEVPDVEITAGETKNLETVIMNSAVPTNVNAIAGSNSVEISWDDVLDASSYNIYWSESQGMSKTNGTKISDVTSPYTLTGLTNGITYYYVVTAVDASGNESDESAEVSATPNPLVINWVEKAPMPINVSAFGYAVVDDNIYIIGGYIPEIGDTTTVQRYTPAEDTWEVDDNNGGSLAPLPAPRSFGLHCGVINREIHVIGGWENGVYKGDHFIYNPDSDIWIKDLPILKYPIGQSAATVNNKIYVFGGWWGSYYDYVFEYSEIDGWSLKNPMPTARTHVTTGVYNGKIFVLGGEGEKQKSLDVVEMYDPETDTWSTGLTPMTDPLGCYFGCSGLPVLDGIIYILTGNAAYGYNPQTDSWETFNPIPDSAAIGIAAINSSIYAIGPEHTFQSILLPPNPPPNLP